MLEYIGDLSIYLSSIYVWNSPFNGSCIMIATNAVRCVCLRERDEMDKMKKKEKMKKKNTAEP